MSAAARLANAQHTCARVRPVVCTEHAHQQAEASVLTAPPRRGRRPCLSFRGRPPSRGPVWRRPAWPASWPPAGSAAGRAAARHPRGASPSVYSPRVGVLRTTVCDYPTAKSMQCHIVGDVLLLTTIQTDTYRRSTPSQCNEGHCSQPCRDARGTVEGCSQAAKSPAPCL